MKNPLSCEQDLSCEQMKHRILNNACPRTSASLPNCTKLHPPKTPRHPSPQHSPLPTSHLVLKARPGIFPGPLAVSRFHPHSLKDVLKTLASFPHHVLAPSTVEDTARAPASAELPAAG